MAAGEYYQAEGLSLEIDLTDRLSLIRYPMAFWRCMRVQKLGRAASCQTGNASVVC